MARNAKREQLEPGDLGEPVEVKLKCSLCGPNKCLYSRGRGINRRTCLVPKEIAN